jgi:hypothetical protein
MEFCIQVSNPKPFYFRNKADESVRDAIESIFPMNTEYAIMVWSGIYIPLSYKYDLSVMYDDIVPMITSMLDTDEGEETIEWGSNTFLAKWNMIWKFDDLRISAQWHSVTGFTELLLSSRSCISISRLAFLAEWKALLRMILQCLSNAGYNDQHLLDLSELKRVEGRIASLGQLYQSQIR